MASYATQRARVPALRKIGTWATWWWAVSGVYVVILVWQARDYYLARGFSWSDWVAAAQGALMASPFMLAVLMAILVVWLAGAVIWFRELKRHHIRYSEALKDLFLTVRK